MERAQPFDLRPVTPNDFDAVVDYRREAYRELAIQRWGHWDDKEQTERYRGRWDPKTTWWILVGGSKAGVLELDHKETETHLRSLVIRPDMQGRGLGTQVLAEIQATAARRSQPIRLRVIKSNARAKKLYERFDFKVESETEDHVHMVWRPVGCF